MSTRALADRIMRHRAFGRTSRDLSRRHGTPVEIVVATHGLSAEEVLWRKSGSGSSFVFDPSTLDHPFGAVLIERWLDLLALIIPAVSAWPSPTGTTAIALGDCGTGRGLSFCDHRPDARLIPDPIFVREAGYAVQRAHFTARPVPWRQRRQRALWRGQTSGWHDAEGRPVASWRDLPRVRLCRMARAPSAETLIDAGITGVVQIQDPDAAATFVREGLMVPHLDWRLFQAWRYLIDVDGNSSAWEGCFTKLLTGSTVLKVGSGFGFRQWYYEALVPWRTMVPVAADLSDLAERIAWLVAHDEEAEALGRAGQAVALGLTLPGETARAAATIRAAFEEGL